MAPVTLNGQPVKPAKTVTIDGQRAAEITFSDVVVGGDGVLGEIDRGYASLEAAIADATLAVSAEAVGIMTVLTEKTIEYAKSRVQFGVPISSFQALQHRMVDMFMSCEQTRSLLYRAVCALDAGDDDAQRSLMALKVMVVSWSRRITESSGKTSAARLNRCTRSMSPE